MAAFRAIHPFQGDPFAGQLSFEPGTVLVVPNAKHAYTNNGWAHGNYANDSKHVGWFPLTYVQPIAVQTSQPAALVVNATTSRLPPTTSVSTSGASYSSNLLEPSHVADCKSHRSSQLDLYPWLDPDFTADTTAAFPQANIWAVEADDEDEGFGGALMGGAGPGSGAMSGNLGGVFRPATSTNTRPAQVQPDSQVASRPASRSRPLQGIGAFSKKTASKTGAALSHAASTTGSAISSAASKTASRTGQAVNESGHRYRDMQQQRQAHLNQNSVTCATATASTKSPSGTTQVTAYEKSVASGGGILPGRRTDKVTTTEKSRWGAAKSTETTTSRPSGGFFPGIRGRTTTTKTTSRSWTGATTVHTNQESRGGFYIIPLGPIGLAAAAALAAKNAYDSRKDRDNTTLHL